jgi:multidrug efflux system membrane fusion protein
MNKTLKILLPIAALLLGLAGAIAIVKARPTVDRQQAAALPPLVRVIEVQPTDLQLIVRSQGTVQPLVESTLVAQVAGRIDGVSPAFAEGGFFNQGDRLVQIDKRDYELAVAQAEAQVAQAQVRLQLETAEAELAREEWQELGSGSSNPLALREPQLAEAEAAVQAAEAALEKAMLDLERTAIRAQFDGRVRTKLVDLGQFINRGTPVANLYSTRAAEVRLPVSKDDLLFVGLDSSQRLDSAGASRPAVTLRATIGGSDFSWAGEIVRTGSEFDTRTRMLPLFARIDDPLRRRSGASEKPLPMGLFVDAEIDGVNLRNVYVLPRSAVRDGSRVLIVDPDSRLRIRSVVVERFERDRAVVKTGLEPNDLVCVSQIEAVVDGMTVRTQLEDSLLVTDATEEEEL